MDDGASASGGSGWCSSRGRGPASRSWRGGGRAALDDAASRELCACDPVCCPPPSCGRYSRSLPSMSADSAGGGWRSSSSTFRTRAAVEASRRGEGASRLAGGSNEALFEEVAGGKDDGEGTAGEGDESALVDGEYSPSRLTRSPCLYATGALLCLPNPFDARCRCVTRLGERRHQKERQLRDGRREFGCGCSGGFLDAL
jgi:hypothetical protein